MDTTTTYTEAIRQARSLEELRSLVRTVCADPARVNLGAIGGAVADRTFDLILAGGR